MQQTSHSKQFLINKPTPKHINKMMAGLSTKSINRIIITGLFLVAANFLYLASIGIAPQATMDSAYYYVMTDQLERGEGFREPFIWHFLGNYKSIDHPMDYWMPAGIIFYYLARIIAGSGRDVFLNIAIWSILSTLVYLEVRRKTGSMYNSVFASLTLLFCGRSLFYLLTTDNIAFYALFGFIFFRCLRSSKSYWYLTSISGAIIALIRIEGILIAIFGALCEFNKTRKLATISGYLLVMLLVMSPWLMRNCHLFGHPWPSSSKALLLNSYNDMFSPDVDLTLEKHISSGLGKIIKQRARATWLSILNLAAVPGLFIMFPLWLIAITKLWNNEGKHFVWLLTFFVFFCGLAIPYQSEMGTAMHISAFFLPSMAIFNGVGLYFLQKRFAMRRYVFFLLSLIILSWALLASLASNRILSTSYSEIIEPYKSLLNKIDLGKRSIVSAIPVQLYLETGARGVMSSCLTATEPIRLADMFNCDTIILDRRSPDYKPLPVIDGWQEIASNSLLNVFFRPKKDDRKLYSP